MEYLGCSSGFTLVSHQTSVELSLELDAEVLRQLDVIRNVKNGHALSGKRYDVS